MNNKMVDDTVKEIFKRINPRLNISVKNASIIKCKCGGDKFQDVKELYLLPAMASASGKPMVIHKNFYRCLSCGEILDLEPLTR